MTAPIFEIPEAVALRLGSNPGAVVLAIPARRPIIEQGWQAEQWWWAQIWRERGLPDPTTVSLDEFRRLCAEKLLENVK